MTRQTMTWLVAICIICVAICDIHVICTCCKDYSAMAIGASAGQIALVHVLVACEIAVSINPVTNIVNRLYSILLAE